jgi:hypothetical protein
MRGVATLPSTVQIRGRHHDHHRSPLGEPERVAADGCPSCG